MTQSALTVTVANPTPPTNLPFVGNTPPLDPAQAAVDDTIPAMVPNSRDLSAANGATINGPGGTITIFSAKTAAANTGGAWGAGISFDAEGKGDNETTVTAPGSVAAAPTIAFSCGPVNNTQALRDAGANARHPSCLSGNATPTVSGATGASNVSGVGTTVLTVTGTNFNRASQVFLNGVAQTTQYVSATSLTVTNALKRTTAGTLPVYVVSNGQQTAPVNWTLT